MRARGGLAEQVTVRYGPRKLLLRYFERVDESICDRGLHILICMDFDRLVRLNESNCDNGPPVMPFNDPSFNTLDDGRAFWLDVRDRRSDTVMTHSARLFDWSDTTLEQETRTLRLLYPDPSPYVARGDAIEIVDAPSAKQITGQVALLASKWVRPDYRGLGIANMVAGATRALSCTLWDPNYIIGFVEPVTHRLGITRTLGKYQVEEGMDFRVAGHVKKRGMLVWMTGQTAFDEIANVLWSGQKRAIAQKRNAQTKLIAAPAGPW